MEGIDKPSGEEDVEFMDVSVISNAIDSLETAARVLVRTDSLKWKWVAIAVHHSLYSFCVAALDRGNPDWLIHEIIGTDEGAFWKGGNAQKWKKSKKVFIGQGPAYRIEWYETDEEPPSPKKDTLHRNKNAPRKSKETLIGFWTALARVQDKHSWMGHSYGMSAVSIGDDEMKGLVWLSNSVRNELIHFVPKHYSICITSIKRTCLIAIEVIRALVFETHALWRIDDEGKNRVKEAINKLAEGLKG